METTKFFFFQKQDRKKSHKEKKKKKKEFQYGCCVQQIQTLVSVFIAVKLLIWKRRRGKLRWSS